MDHIIIPKRHPDPWVDLLRAYVTETVEALTAGGVRVRDTWLDPADPRDATVLCSRPGEPGLALVWDEEAGWRRGRFVAGEPGSRTVLADAAHLGGGVLPEPGELVRRLVIGAVAAPRAYRTYSDVRDGLDDALRARALPLAVGP